MTALGRWLALRRGTPSEKPAAADVNRATEFAWRVHGAQATWASNADVKASILLALEGGALYAVISGLGGGIPARLVASPHAVTSAIGISALLLAIVAAAIAIFPRLGQRDKARDRGRQVIYFGDLRRWGAAELRTHITGLGDDEELDMLSRQLTEMSRHNWVKHRWVQVSLLLSLTGIAGIAVSFVTPL